MGHKKEPVSKDCCEKRNKVMNRKSSEQRLRHGKPLGSNYLLHGGQRGIFFLDVQNNVLILYNY